MKLAVYGNKAGQDQMPYIQTFFEILNQRGIPYTIYEPYVQELASLSLTPFGTFSGKKELINSKVDFLVTLGGDGTILNAATVICESTVPILGINLGRLGFLASVEKTIIAEAITQLEHGSFYLDTRIMLELQSNYPIFGESPFALNDMAILKRDNSSMIIIHTYVNGDFLNSYWADGLIVATPTGSTAYSLSCGGPIMYPESNVLIITPVAPHNLNIRPIVLPDDAEISFEIEGRTEHFLCTLDSRYELIDANHQISVKRAQPTISLVRLQEMSFLKTMREKLRWGSDSRKNY